MKKITTARAQSESVTDQPVEYKKHTLYQGTLGHLKWLLARNNKTLTGGAAEMDSVIEICFAYTTDPLALQKITGAKAKEAIENFGNALTNEEFARLQTHAETQLLKYAKTLAVPKKKAARQIPKATRRPRKR